MIPHSETLKVDVTFSEELGDANVTGAPSRRRFYMRAYTGAVFTRSYGRAVIDLEGLSYPEKGVPIFRDHKPGKFIGRSEPGVGCAVQANFEGLVGLDVAGSLFEGVQEANEVATISDQGGQWQASVGIDIDSSELELCADGETLEVNGRTIDGPCIVFRKTQLREVSFVPVGADTATSAIALSGQHEKEAAVSVDKNEPTVADERARVKQIREAFKADTDFALESIDKGWSVTEAKAAYADRLAERLSAAENARKEAEQKFEERLADAKKEAKESIAAKLGSGAALAGATPSVVSDDPVVRWEEKLAAETQRILQSGSPIRARSSLKLSPEGAAKQIAVQNLARQEPETYSAYLDAFNSRGLGRRRQK